MPLLVRYDTPAFLPDFDSIPGQLEAWHKAVSAWFDQNIKDDKASFGENSLLYYNAANFDPGGITVEQEITWNAFPKELLRRYGRERALVLANQGSARYQTQFAGEMPTRVTTCEPESQHNQRYFIGVK